MPPATTKLKTNREPNNKKKALLAMSTKTVPVIRRDIAKETGINSNTIGPLFSKMRTAKEIEEVEDGKFVITDLGLEFIGKGRKPMTPSESDLTSPQEKKPTTKPPQVFNQGEQNISETADKVSPVKATSKQSSTTESEETDKETPDDILSLEELGATNRQLFQNMGVLVGIRRETIRLVAEMVWSGGNCYDLDWVWQKMTEAQIPYDMRLFWINTWKSRVVQEYPEKNQWHPPSLAQIEAEQSKEKELAKAKVESDKPSGPRAWLLGANGRPVNVGEGAGMYTFAEAQNIGALDILKKDAQAALEAAKANGGGSEKVSEVIAALQPFLNKEGRTEGEKEKLSEVINALLPLLQKGENGSSEQMQSMFKELMETKMEMLGREISQMVPQQAKPWYEALPTIITALSTAAPTIRQWLGVPDMNQFIQLIESRLPKQDGNASLSLADQNGNPLRIDLRSLLEIKKFEAEQNREDQKVKNSQDTMAVFREFMGKIGNAASRMGGG